MLRAFTNRKLNQTDKSKAEMRETRRVLLKGINRMRKRRKPMIKRRKGITNAVIPIPLFMKKLDSFAPVLPDQLSTCSVELVKIW